MLAGLALDLSHVRGWAHTTLLSQPNAIGSIGKAWEDVEDTT